KLKSARGPGFGDAATTAKINPIRVKRCEDAINAELKTGGIRHTAEIRLIGDSVRTHAGCNCAIDAYTESKVVVRIWSWSRGGRNGCLAGLDLLALGLAQQDKLSGALEVVALSVEGSDVRITR